jgi:oligopeptide/dipeptide ABC transporter ATP-binding protein
VQDLRVSFAVAGPRARLVAVDGLSFHIDQGETLALVGESGSGKSTVARALLGLVSTDRGRIDFEGQDLARLPKRAFRSVRLRLQMVFQDPWAALNPRMRIGALIDEPLRFVAAMDSAQRRGRVLELIRHVDLDEAILDRHPAALSGGQLQRVCIARAIATAPMLLVLDEPTSSLDLSVRGSILALLRRLQDETGMSMLLISHDIGSVRRLAKRVTVLYLGRAMESGAIDEVFESPAHPYTRALLDAYLPLEPGAHARQACIAGEMPSPTNPPSGCPFQPRCRDRLDRCCVERPGTVRVGARQLACHLYTDSTRLPKV